MKRIAVITSGGDCPGMNAALRGIVRAGIAKGLSIVGFYHGYRGILQDEFIEFQSSTVGGIISSGGTILRTARCSEFRALEGRKKAYENLKKHGIEGLIVIGGDGSLSGALCLFEEFKLPVIGIPASIDNDLSGTTYSIGFDTALNTALSAIDKVRDTAYSHDRVFVVEVMGRENGFIALDVALAAGAEAVLLPEFPYSLKDVCEDLKEMRETGKRSSIIVVAEGAAKAITVKDFISEYTGFETRYIVLGHMQRGGSPTAFDRVLAIRFATEAVDALLRGEKGVMVGIESNEYITIDLKQVIGNSRKVDLTKIELVKMMST